jgi:antitoxin StbD
VAQRPVLTTIEARTQLSEILRRFRAGGDGTEPVLFGDHRKAEAVLIPYQLWTRLEAAADDPELLEGLLDGKGGSS